MMMMMMNDDDDDDDDDHDDDDDDANEGNVINECTLARAEFEKSMASSTKFNHETKSQFITHYCFKI